MKRSLYPVAFGAVFALAFGCSTNPQSVRTKMLDFTEKGLYSEARAVEVKRNPGGIPQTAEEAMKEDLIKTVVNPTEIASRIKTLTNKVMAQIKAKDYEGARASIHSFGTVGVPEVDSAVFAMKLAILNARINPAAWEQIRTQSVKAVDAALAKEDFKAAGGAIDRLVLVPGYSIDVDDALKLAAKAAHEQSIDPTSANEVVLAAQKQLYEAISPRPDNIHDEEILKAYFMNVAEMTDYVYQPNWEEVRKALNKASASLVNDDVDEEVASKFADGVLSDFMAIFRQTAEERLPTMTTQELNKKIGQLKMELSSRVSKVIDQKMKAALDAARASKDAKAKENAKKYEQMALEAAARAARDVDFYTRINAFVQAVNDRVEPSVNRILGDGARVLRILKAGGSISREDATSLLAAATYMGFDEVMHYALILGADVNGHSPKDTLARSPLLLALQYGCKGNVWNILTDAHADLATRDGRGRGTVHYAVLGANNGALMDLLRSLVDTKTADKDGVTPLILAADHGYSALVRMLLPFSDLEAQDKDGFTALLRAAEDGRVDLVRLLIMNGANPRQQSKEGDGLVELAAAANAPELLVYLLDEKKYAPTERCVAQLVVAGNVPTLQQMVAHGAKLTDKHLAAAVKLLDLPMAKYLVSRGMDVNADCVKSVMASIKEEKADEIRAFLHDQGQR